ncbi:PAS domain S-box-containing protein [Methylorubrum rhodinum]|uniref:Blue-light-activated histidine kinase n=1 Tax=Methylorubrum rhodinum TaxID=29428 RepID=A0A840ZKV5_9HYPH|nr:PAS domain-containing protein [Methylorubrum rhodinum]MBB5758206.1 PAS domain S-box-containing protein [Methylorubrum rhodinum]
MNPSVVADPARLAALDALAILATPAEEGFDDLVRLATRLCAVPVALVSLVAVDRQWFKARIGFPSCETDLDRSVCKLALAQPDLLVIPDLTADPRTRDNPLVTGEPGIRFYAGAPLRLADGNVVGSLCVIDTVPRPGGLTPDQADDLRALGRQASALLEARRSEERYRTLFENIDAGFCVCEVKFDEDGRAVDHRVLAANPAFERHTGLSDAVGRWANAIAPGIEQHWHDAYGQVARTGKPLRFEGEAAPLGRWYDAHLFPAGGGRVAMLIADTTARRRSETALRESEALARANIQRVQLALAAGAIIGTWHWDIPSDRFTTDEAFADAFGLDLALGRDGVPLAEIVATVHPDDRSGLAAAIAEAVARGGAYAHQYRVRRADGRYYWIEANGRVEHGPDGTPLSFPGVVLDIEGRHAAEQALRLTEERLQLALTASGVVGLWDWMVDTDLLHGDARFARLYGLDVARTAAGLTMEQFQAFVVPEDVEPLRARIRDTFERGAPFGVEYRLAIPGEALRWVECKGQLTHDAAGAAVRFSGTAVDITDRKTAEARLAESEAHWRGLFERLSEGFLVGEVVRDHAGRITDWRYVDVNAAWGPLVGLDPACIVGRTLREVLPGVEDEWVDEFAGVVESGQPVTFTRRVSTLRRWYEGRAFPLGSERFGMIFLDVTARVEADTRRDALLELGERLRDLDTVPALVGTAAGILARVNDATRAGYGLVDAARETVEVLTDWHAPDTVSVAGRHGFRTYGSYIEDLKRGEVVAIDDVTRDPRTRDNAAALLAIGVRVLLNVPILERGRLVGIAFVNWADHHPFTGDDLAFVRTVADRVQSAVARLQAEADQRVLNEELSHRLKNTFAMVISIATQTLRTVPERAPVEAFERRIHAPSSAHDVLLRQSWAAAPAREVMRAVLANAGHGDRVDLAGPELDLGPRATLSLSLLLHELATNAAKYGALSVPDGRVAVEWQLAGEGEAREVSLDWTERGGPPPTPPVNSGRKGFGSRLIHLGLVGTGGVDLRYPPSGFQATMRAPLVQLQHS